MTARKNTYAEGILEAFEYLLTNHEEVLVIGQGLWSPWYVGSSMRDLDKKFGRDRVMDTPVSEDATTAIAAGAGISGYRAIVVHPRIDFMVLASNSLVNQIAKWSHMLGGRARPSVTIRGIVNRGGEQGAQHSQSLHSWFAHVPGLRVVMPATAQDARDLLIASVLCDDPVLYIDDRWCYDVVGDFEPAEPVELRTLGPVVLREGRDVTIVGAGHSTQVALETADVLASSGLAAEVIDLRVINPLDATVVIDSVRKTGRLAAIDGSWRSCGLAGEVIASVAERSAAEVWKSAPLRFTLPDAPAPTSKALEDLYYHSAPTVAAEILRKQFGVEVSG
jgi:pyruvate/2-oxoglutarate/acetoin dehydrogenase E1 component